MNDMAARVGYAVDAAGGLSCLDVDAINRQLRRTPYNRDGYLYPIDQAQTQGDARSRRRQAAHSPHTQADS